MSHTAHLSRRRFLRRCCHGAAVGIAVPTIAPSGALGLSGKAAASDKIRLGIIGAGSMGRANLDACGSQDDVVVTAVSDVWRERRDAALAKYQPAARGYGDYRELLARDDVDAVIIATPPHWHALQAIEACQAGKDIYLQKPMTLYPAETIAVRNAVRRHGRVSQIGTQIHAGENYRRVVEFVRSGKLGKISVVRTFNVMNQGAGGLGDVPDSDPPEGLDWSSWVGPAPMRRFNPLCVRDAYTHSSFWNFSGGWTPGMAPHILDLPVWALDLGLPEVTSSVGGRFTIRDPGDAPDTQEVTWQYAGLTMTWMMNLVNSYGFDFKGDGSISRRLGIYFHGLNGTLWTDYGSHTIQAEGDRLPDSTPPEKSIPPSPGHEREWLDCVKSRKDPSCSVDYHYRIDLAITLANLSQRLGRSVRLDPRSERIVGDPEAARLARPEYRAPWKFPAEYLEPWV